MYFAHRPASWQLELGANPFDCVSGIRDLERQNDLAARLCIEWSCCPAQHDAANQTDVDFYWNDERR